MRKRIALAIAVVVASVALAGTVGVSEASAVKCDNLKCVSKQLTKLNKNVNRLRRDVNFVTGFSIVGNVCEGDTLVENELVPGYDTAIAGDIGVNCVTAWWNPFWGASAASAPMTRLDRDLDALGRMLARVR